MGPTETPLPIPPAPARFLMPPNDPAGRAARELATWARNRGREPRVQAVHPRWSSDPAMVWSIRPQAECLAELREAGVPHRLLHWTPASRLPTPVEIDPPIIGGVRFRKTVQLPLIIACELAARLPIIADVLSRHSVIEVEVVSAYRQTPSSFHSVGMALDLKSFTTTAGRIMVEHGFEKTPDHPTCDAPEPRDRNARLLRAIVCDLAATRRFSSVITPNYNQGHFDHIHVDVRPDDPRLFVR